MKKIEKEVVETVSENPAPRAMIQDLAESMEAEMAANDHKLGWLEDSSNSLIDQAYKNLSAAEEALFRGDYKRMRKCLVDCANFSGMVCDQERAGKVRIFVAPE